jgi:hypothetical protein
MSQPKELLLLNNAMNCVNNTYNFIKIKPRHFQAININSILSIKKSNKGYSYYYKITMTNGKKIYVNEYINVEASLMTLTISYVKNEDYIKLDNYMKGL